MKYNLNSYFYCRLDNFCGGAGEESFHLDFDWPLRLISVWHDWTGNILDFGIHCLYDFYKYAVDCTHRSVKLMFHKSFIEVCIIIYLYSKQNLVDQSNRAVIQWPAIFYRWSQPGWSQAIPPSCHNNVSFVSSTNKFLRLFVVTHSLMNLCSNYSVESGLLYTTSSIIAVGVHTHINPPVAIFPVISQIMVCTCQCGLLGLVSLWMTFIPLGNWLNSDYGTSRSGNTLKISGPIVFHWYCNIILVTLWS